MELNHAVEKNASFGSKCRTVYRTVTSEFGVAKLGCKAYSSISARTRAKRTVG